jgi:hypothetical protein
MSKANVKADEWTKISDEFSASQNAAIDAFAALAEFDATAPSEGGQKAYDNWHGLNEEERADLEHATIVAALDYVAAHSAQRKYFEREEHDGPYICPDCRANAH